MPLRKAPGISGDGGRRQDEGSIGCRPDSTEGRWLLEYLLVSKARGDAADPALPLMLWWWVLVFQGGRWGEGCGKDREQGSIDEQFQYFHHSVFFFIRVQNVCFSPCSVVSLFSLFILLLSDLHPLKWTTTDISRKGFFIPRESFAHSLLIKLIFCMEVWRLPLHPANQFNPTVKFLPLVCHKYWKRKLKGPELKKNHFAFTSVSLGTRIPLRQLTTQQKEVLRKSKNNDTNSVQVCVYTLGPMYQDPVCAEANQALDPQKKILNTHTPF